MWARMAAVVSRATATDSAASPLAMRHLPPLRDLEGQGLANPSAARIFWPVSPVTSSTNLRASSGCVDCLSDSVAGTAIVGHTDYARGDLVGFRLGQHIIDL